MGTGAIKKTHASSTFNLGCFSKYLELFPGNDGFKSTDFAKATDIKDY